MIDGKRCPTCDRLMVIKYLPGGGTEEFCKKCKDSIWPAAMQADRPIMTVPDMSDIMRGT